MDWLEVDDPRWRSFLHEESHDVYHLPEYLELSAEYEGGHPTAFLARDGDDALLVPLLRRELPTVLDAPPGCTDASSPYGYPSPLFSRATTPDGGRALVAALREAAAEASLVSVFLRLHPLLERPAGALESASEVVTHGPTVPIDLHLTPEEMWSQTRSTSRNEINKLRRLGFEIVIDAWDCYQDFQQVYQSTMNRNDAADFYRFPNSYFDGLRETLGPRLHLFSAISPDGDYAGGALLTGEGDILQYHLGGTDPHFHGNSPSKLIFGVARTWGKEQGYRWLHLGGGVGGAEDSLFRFKAGFSRRRAVFETCRMVPDEDRYAQLGADLGMEPAGRGGFFPLYRAASAAGGADVRNA